MAKTEKRTDIMRLYNIFYVCKLHYPILKNIKVEDLPNNASTRIHNWPDIQIALNALEKIDCLHDIALKPYTVLNNLDRYIDDLLIPANRKTAFMESIKEITISVEALVKLCDYLELGQAESGIDIKIPQCESLKEYMGYLKDIDFLFTQCPFLLSDKEQVRFKSVDVGSQWLVYIITGAGAGFYILKSLAKLIEKTVQIRSNLIVCKQQEAMLKEMELKNEVTQETIDIFRSFKQKVLDNAVSELETDIHKLKDGEEHDKVIKSIELLHSLMERGVEIYSSIETPKEVKVLFPFENDSVLLPDNVLKLLEEKN